MPRWGVLGLSLLPSALLFFRGVVIYERRFTQLETDVRWIKRLLVQNGFATQREADDGGA